MTNEQLYLYLQSLISELYTIEQQTTEVCNSTLLKCDDINEIVAPLSEFVECLEDRLLALGQSFKPNVSPMRIEKITERQWMDAPEE